MKGFSAFLERKRCKDCKSVPENIEPSKDLFHPFLWSTECLAVHPEFPSEGAEGQQLQEPGFNLPRGRWQMPLLLFSSWQMLLTSASF